MPRMTASGCPRFGRVHILSLGFLVASLDEAVAELHAAGVATDPPATNEVDRYVHFTAPDGHLYELVERR